MKRQQTSIFKAKKDLPISGKFRQGILASDGFGCNVQFLCKRNEQHQTFYGGCFTLMIIFLTTYYLYQLLNTLINQDDPQTVFTEVFVEKPQLQELPIEDYTFVFGLNDWRTYQPFQNRSIFTVTLNQCIKTSVNDTATNKIIVQRNCTNVPLERCDVNKHVKIESQKAYFSRVDLSQYYCADSKYVKDHPLVIEGTYDAEVYQWIKFIASPCRNETGIFEDCASQEEIDDRLSGGFVNLYWIDRIGDPSKPGDPFTPMGRNYANTYSNQINKEFDIYLRHTFVESDLGLVGSDIQEYHSLQFGYVTEFIDMKRSKDFLSLIVRLDQKKTVIYRSYQKLQDILGLVGGLWQFMTMLGILLVVPVNKLDLQLKILNQIFAFESKSDTPNQSINVEASNQEQVKSGTQTIAKDNRLATMNSGLFIRLQSRPNNDTLHDESNGNHGNQQVLIQQLTQKQRNKQVKKVFNQLQSYQSSNQSMPKKKNLEIFKNYIKLNMGKISLQTYEYIGYFAQCFKGTNHKKQQIDFGIRQMEKQMDILYVIKKLTELEKLKMLLLTPEQLQLFEYLPKPCIPRESDESTIQQRYEELLGESEDKQMSFWQTLQSQKTIYQKASEAYDAYLRIMGKERKSRLDDKLVKFLDIRIKRLFDLGIEKQPKSVQKQVMMQQSIDLNPPLSQSPNLCYASDSDDEFMEQCFDEGAGSREIKNIRPNRDEVISIAQIQSEKSNDA